MQDVVLFLGYWMPRMALAVIATAFVMMFVDLHRAFTQSKWPFHNRNKPT